MWEPFAFLAYIGAMTVAVHRMQSARLQMWRETVAGCGLHLEEVSSALAFRVNLRARGGLLEVRIRATGRSGASLRITVVIPGPPGFAGMRIRREHYRPAGAREIEVGEERFDGSFFVEGPMRLAFVLLDAEARSLLLRANDLGKLEIFHGELQVDSSDEHLSKLLPLLLDLGRRLTRDVDAAQCLADNAAGDPAPGVRLKNLLLLVREHPGAPGTVETLRAACTDPSSHVRLCAATALGAEGLPLLRELTQSTDDDISAQALSVVGGELPFEDTRAILDHALRRRRLQVAHACLEVLGRRGGEPEIAALVKVMALEKGELAVAAAQALGEAGNPDAEPPLIQALCSERADLRVAAANALGRAGSVAAVLPLKDAAEHFPRDSDLQRTTRQAIARIQTRLPGASPGQLSLAGDEQGQLSLAESEVGQLSLAPEPAGGQSPDAQSPAS